MFLEGGEMSRLAQKGHKNSAGINFLNMWKCITVPQRSPMCQRLWATSEVDFPGNRAKTINERALFTVAGHYMELIRSCTGHLGQ